MTRTIVALHEQDKSWLEQYSRLHHQSMAETIRQAITCYRSQFSAKSEHQVLRETAGLWHGRATDGLDYQQELRDEWGETAR